MSDAPTRAADENDCETDDHAAPTFRSALRTLMMPRDTNPHGTIFGGVILSHVDQAGYVEARRHGLHKWVTVAMDAIEFQAPVHVGDVVDFRTRTTRCGRSSVTVEVVVDAERYESGETVRVTQATVVMVAVGPNGNAIPMTDPPTVTPVHQMGVRDG